jgi:uncharacterized membrane protein (UPF0127 family)/CheY-like chemotaxis protein
LLRRRAGTLTLRREDGRIVCEKVFVAATFTRRLRGLLGRKSLPPGEGVTLRPAFSIHTAFMRFPIDAIFLDNELVVLKIVENLRPFRTASSRGAREVVELAAGECARRGLAVGDRVAWASHATVVPLAPGTERAETEPRGRVVIASRDARFVKLVRFLVEGKGIETVTVATQEKLSDVLEREHGIDAVVLDAQDSVAATLTTANAARTLRPEVAVVIAGETSASQRAPVGVRLYDKWNETEDLLAAVEASLGEELDPDVDPLGAGA